MKRILYLLLLLCLFVVLSGPQWIDDTEQEEKKWIDIVLAVDISQSMEANDLQPDRLMAAKNALQSFLATRKTDRVGLVVFAGKPFTSIPLTFDYSIFQEILNRTDTNTIDQKYQHLQWTAIGDALLSSITLLEKWRDEKHKDREQIIVLFTDGTANVGIEPRIVAKSAKDKHIKIYSIGIGSKEWWVISVPTAFGSRQMRVEWVDEATLQEIATTTQWLYTRAVDNSSLDEIVKNIGNLQASTIQENKHYSYRDATPFFVWIAFVLACCLVVVEKKYPVL